MSTVLTLKRVKISDIGDYIQLLGLEYPSVNIEGQSFEKIAQMISETFQVSCTTKDVELSFRDDDPIEDFELASRKMEFGITEY